jgi:hypothetical protein
VSYASENAVLDEDDDTDDDFFPRKGPSLTEAVRILSIDDIRSGAVPPPPNEPPPPTARTPVPPLPAFPSLSLQSAAASSIPSPLPSPSYLQRIDLTVGDVTREGNMMAWSKAKIGGGFKPAHFRLENGVLV